MTSFCFSCDGICCGSWQSPVWPDDGIKSSPIVQKRPKRNLNSDFLKEPQKVTIYLNNFGRKNCHWEFLKIAQLGSPNLVTLTATSFTSTPSRLYLEKAYKERFLLNGRASRLWRPEHHKMETKLFLCRFYALLKVGENESLDGNQNSQLKDLAHRAQL